MLMVTCGSVDEAETIARQLLTAQLIACAKRIPIQAMFLWRGAVDQAQEVLLCMETVQDHCTAIDATIRTIHSYDTYVLVGIPIIYVSDQAARWLQESVKR